MTLVAETLARIHALNHRNALGAVADLDEDRLRSRPPRTTSIAFRITTSIRYEARQLGMIEALKGAAGLRGTATV